MSLEWQAEQTNFLADAEILPPVQSFAPPKLVEERGQIRDGKFCVAAM